MIKFKKLTDTAITPTRGTEGAAGWDLYADTRIFQENENQIWYDTNIAVEIPKGFVGLLFPRSSVSKTDLRLANCVGVIDSDYRGNIQFRYDLRRNIRMDGLKYLELGERIGQLVIVPYNSDELQEVEELSDTERGEGGYGSTGK